MSDEVDNMAEPPKLASGRKPGKKYCEMTTAEKLAYRQKQRESSIKTYYRHADEYREKARQKYKEKKIALEKATEVALAKIEKIEKRREKARERYRKKKEEGLVKKETEISTDIS